MDNPYILKRSSRRTIGLSLDRDGNVIVRAPYACPKSAIDRFVRENEAWILRRREQIGKDSAAAEAEGRLSGEDIKRLADEMVRILPDKLSLFAARLGVTYGRVTVRNQRSKWGSCTAKGNLNFNCLLLLAPEEVLDYVIVHELCHLRHMDHSKEFWAEVVSLDPDHKAHRKWLREHGGALMKRAEAAKEDA